VLILRIRIIQYSRYLPCSLYQTCLVHDSTILLSDIGKCYHAFPRGSFRAQFSLPAVPQLVFHHFSAHPFCWSWITKADPNAGTSFQVPTVPTLCPKDSPKAIHWIVSIFHVFKSQLAPQALNPEIGRENPAYVKLYQTNMLLHLHAQHAHLMVRKPPPASPTCAAPQPVANIPPQPTGTIVELCVEIVALRREVQAL